MFYEGKRRTLPSSRYATALDIIEETGWTYDELADQPADLITELSIRINKRRKAENKPRPKPTNR